MGSPARLDLMSLVTQVNHVQHTTLQGPAPKRVSRNETCVNKWGLEHLVHETFMLAVVLSPANAAENTSCFRVTAGLR